MPFCQTRNQTQKKMMKAIMRLTLLAIGKANGNVKAIKTASTLKEMDLFRCTFSKVAQPAAAEAAKTPAKRQKEKA